VVIAKSMSVTSVSNRNVTPWSSSHRYSGSTIDSYWLYLKNRTPVKSGMPPMWWTKRCTYSFISSAECHSSKANMVRQYIQKLLAKNSLPKTSLIRLPSIDSRVARKSSVSSFCACSERVKSVPVPASLPCSTVARCSE